MTKVSLLIIDIELLKIRLTSDFVGWKISFGFCLWVKSEGTAYFVLGMYNRSEGWLDDKETRAKGAKKYRKSKQNNNKMIVRRKLKGKAGRSAEMGKDNNKQQLLKEIAITPN